MRTTIQSLLLTIILLGLNNFCISQTDTTNIALAYENTISAEDSLHLNSLIYQYGRKISDGTNEYRIGMFGKNVKKEFTSIPLAQQEYKKYRMLSIRGTVLFWGGYAALYATTLTMAATDNMGLMGAMLISEAAIVFGITDLCRKRKYMSKAIWLRNNQVNQ